jgi:AraC-like DNA-binding protein
LLSSVFTFLLREVKAGRQSHHPYSFSKSTFNDDSVQQIRDYIQTHLLQSLTIEKVAQAMYMSPSQFTRHIRREAGQSFVEMMTECRLEVSKRLLREKDWSIAAVARHVGFKSSTYFITFFGKHVGCSPGEYRNASKNDRK